MFDKVRFMRRLQLEVWNRDSVERGEVRERAERLLVGGADGRNALSALGVAAAVAAVSGAIACDRHLSVAIGTKFLEPGQVVERLVMVRFAIHRSVVCER